MVPRIVSLVVVGMLVLASDRAGAQVVGPARRAMAGAAAAAGAPGVGARMEGREAARGISPGERWRYVQNGNQWWYYGPQQSWMFYRNNNWSAYDPNNYTGPAVPAVPVAPNAYPGDGAMAGSAGMMAGNPDQWRYVQNGNQWWYYTPQQTWLMYRNNSWAPYEAGARMQPRYQTGYRGRNRAFSQTPSAPPAVPVAPQGTERAAPQQPQPAQPQQQEPQQLPNAPRAAAQPGGQLNSPGQVAPQAQAQPAQPGRQQQQAEPQQPTDQDGAQQPAQGGDEVQSPQPARTDKPSRPREQDPAPRANP